ncbi:hypothetical protein LBMAG42_26350 [Deltaproteobacteria bacterium]|nr:hypothetical protein LBMAG42_26350 [Deltaproteobacteria bacterium]
MLLAWTLVALAGSWDDFGPMPAGNRLISENLGPDLARYEIEGEGGRYWIDVTPERPRGPDEAAGSQAGAPPTGSFCQGGGLTLQVRKNLDDDHESFELDPVPAPVKQACEGLSTAALPLRARMAAMAPVHAPGPDGEPVTDDGAGGGSGQPEGGASVATSGWASPGNRAFAQFGFRPGQVVVLAWMVATLVSLVAAGRKPRELAMPAAIFALALALRVVFAPITALLGGDAAYERLGLAFGRGSLDRYYGDTWPSLFGLIHEFTQRIGFGPALPSDIVHHVNLLASAATAPVLWGLCRRAGFSAYAAAAAGFGLACLPHAVTLAHIEDHAVLVGLLQVLAGFAVLGTTRADAAFAVLSAALLAHLRPDQLPAAGVLLLPLLARRQWMPFAVGALLVGSRLAYLPPPQGSGPIQFVRLLQPGDWRSMAAAWTGAGGRLTVGVYAVAVFGLVATLKGPSSLSPLTTRGLRWAGAVMAVTALVFVPGELRFVLPAAVALALIALTMQAAPTARPPRIAAWLALVLVATTALYLPKDLPAADPLRFSLPSAAWALALAAMGGETLLRAWSSDRRLAAAGIALVVGIGAVGIGAPPTQPRPWVWEEEYRFLREELPTRAGAAMQGRPRLTDPVDLRFDADAPRGWYDNGQDPNGAFGRWLSVSTGMTWVPWTAGTPKPGDLVFRGSADRLASRWTGERCGLEPLAEREAAPTSDGWVDFGSENVRFSLYSVRECGG